MFQDDITVFFNHGFDFFHVIGFDLVLMHQNEIFTIPFKLGITVFPNDVDMNGKVFKTKEHEYKTVGAKQFRHSGFF